MQLAEEQTSAMMGGDLRRCVELGQRGLVVMQGTAGMPPRLLGQQETSIGICHFMLEEYALARDAYVQAALVFEIAVLLGESVSQVISPIWLRRGAGVVFIVLGVIFLLGRG